MSETEQTEQAQAAPAADAVQATIVHREYVLWGWRDLDPCLWRFFRSAGPWRPLPDADEALLDRDTGQLVTRAATLGDISFTLGYLTTAEDARPFTFTGAIALLPQANGTTQVQVLRFGSTEHDAAIDAALVALWQAARAWVAEQANGQPAAQRAGAPALALPRRARMS